MSEFDPGATGLRIERDGPLPWCVTDRPQARNALTPVMYLGIKRAVRLVNASTDVRALIITGTDDVFALGSNLCGCSGPGDTVVPEGFS